MRGWQAQTSRRSLSYLHVRFMTSITPLYLLCWSCRRARTTWYGYVVTTANIFDNAAIVMYSIAFCLHRQTDGEKERGVKKWAEQENRWVISSPTASYQLWSQSLLNWKVTNLMLQFNSDTEHVSSLPVARGVNDSPALHLKVLSCICCSLSWAPHTPWTAELHAMCQTGREHNPLKSIHTVNQPELIQEELLSTDNPTTPGQ